MESCGNRRQFPGRGCSGLRCKLRRNCVARDFVIKVPSVCWCFSPFRNFIVARNFPIVIFYLVCATKTQSELRQWKQWGFLSKLWQVGSAVGEQEAAGLGTQCWLGWSAGELGALGQSAGATGAITHLDNLTLHRQWNKSVSLRHLGVTHFLLVHYYGENTFALLW